VRSCSQLTASLNIALSPLELASSQSRVCAIVYTYFISRKLFYLWKIIINPFLLKKMQNLFQKFSKNLNSMLG
jgi:hypothetical protein